MLIINDALYANLIYVTICGDYTYEYLHIALLPVELFQ